MSDEMQSLDELLDNITGKTTSPNQRLNVQAGRKYAMKGPATVRVTRQDKMELLREKDLQAIRADLDMTFNRMIAAVSNTPIQSAAISKINVLKRQLFSLIDKRIK